MGKAKENGKPMMGSKHLMIVKSASSISLNKKRRHMKGASQLDLNEKKIYDIKIVTDPSAKASKRMDRAGGNGPIHSGDGDIWVEKMFRHRETGETRIFFISKQTGKKVKQEPPTGASTVMYLRQSYKRKNERKKYSKPLAEKQKVPDKKDNATSGKVCDRRKKHSCITCIPVEDQTIR